MKSNQPLVSIALCTYNGEKYFQHQLDSLLKQDYPNIEILIIDDASTDGTIDILKTYQSTHSQIKLLINESNIGFNQNFIKAITNCNGDYIAVSDQDDIWLPNKVSVMINHIGNNFLLYHDSEFIDENGLSKGKSVSKLNHFVRGNCTSQLLYNNCISGHACFIDKNFINIIPDIPKGMYYDWWFAYTAACVGKLDFINLKLVKHRRHANSSTHNDKSNSKSNRYYHLILFKNHPLAPDSTKILIENLLSGYEELKNQAFSTSLFLTFITNFNTLFYIRKRSLTSKIKFIIRECRRDY